MKRREQQTRTVWSVVGQAAKWIPDTSAKLRWTALLLGLLLVPLDATAQHYPRRPLQKIVEDSGLIVIATARSVDMYAYDFNTKEPLTKVEFDVSTTLFGTEQKQATFFLNGGFLPNGDLAVNTLTSVFVPGETYLLFIKDGPYFFTPFTDGLALRLLQSGKDKHLVDEDGNVVELAEGGIATGDRKFNTAHDLRARALGLDNMESVVAPVQPPAAPQGRRMYPASGRAPKRNLFSSEAAAPALDSRAATALARVSSVLSAQRTRGQRERAPIEYRHRPEK